jgi:sortase A
MKRTFKRFLKAIGIIFSLTITIIICLIFYRRYQVEQFKDNIEITKLSKEAKKYPDSEVSNNWNSIQDAQVTALKMGIPNNAYGILKIPAINLQLPIFRGSNEYTLSLGVATYFYDEAVVGKGNLVLAGHSTPYEGVLLTNLSDVKERDKIEVKTTEQTYSYIVDKIQVVDDDFKLIAGKLPSDSFLSLPTETEKAKVTLFTCVNWQDNSQRLVVSGHLNI